LRLHLGWHGLSAWSRSPAKRLLDCIFVMLAAPVAVPLMVLAAAAVRFTSPGPVLFRQARMGQAGKTFVILKLRTMEHTPNAKHHPVTTSTNQRFTPVGPFLRRWKLDELPQIVNVLRGDLSLVGPRPKLSEHTILDLPCRPGITGLATVAFANEEAALAKVPQDCLKDYYHSFVLPLKQQLDASYMARATLLSDLRIILKSVMRRGEGAALDGTAFASATAPGCNIATRSRQTGKTSPQEREHRSVVMEVS
jgi:lipopolysaccharide/colanic/teichoic acid biosynthesis glycosyltransferase